MINFDVRPYFLLLLTIACLGLIGLERPAQAQSVFCPTSVSQGADFTVPGITLAKGACTNPSLYDVKTIQKPEAGAFSGAALAGQAIGNLAQSMSVVETATTTRQIEQRRATEERICAPGETLVDGICRAAAAPVVMPAVTTPIVRPVSASVVQPTTPAYRRPVATKRVAPAERPVARRQARNRSERGVVAPAAIPVALPPSYIIPSHWGVWAQGFGDYEERSGHSTSQIMCCNNITSAPLGLNASSSTTTAGFVGGIDWTARNVRDAGDGLILGLMTGYLDSTVTVNTSALSGDLASVGNGFGRMRAHLSGPSVGAYVTYFDGPWSNDLLIKNDFLDLNESFSDLQAFQTCGCTAPGAVFTPFTQLDTGRGSASLNEFTVSDNVHYRMPLMTQMWIEPTVGIQYTLSSYAGNSAALGLNDGDLVRLQGGARVGEDTLLGAVPVTLAVTGLVYDDVLVSGDFIQGGAFGTSGNILNDQGKVRGEGIVDAKFDLGQGRSIFVQGDVRGGDSLFGGGGKGGFRIEW